MVRLECIIKASSHVSASKKSNCCVVIAMIFTCMIKPTEQKFIFNPVKWSEATSIARNYKHSVHIYC